ncbi:MAG: arginine--tRNA ligase [Alphaproteobacteria bacterium]|jgi:arginyl-tRNA synthetase|nr:arginine--tRNA ligase [Alphaproteobacteria bacterium]
MDPFKHFAAEIDAALGRLAQAGKLPKLDTSAVTVEPPRDPLHGDLATNAALVLTKLAGKKPREIADLLAAELRQNADVTEVTVAGPGFVNLRLSDGFWRARLKDVLVEGPAYGDSKAGAAKKVNVEYVSANPTGPLHVAHARGAVYGDVLASLLEKVGYEVTREYYINDAGAQVDMLARSAWLRYREALGDDIGEIPDGLYPGDYLKPVGEALAEQYGDKYKSAPETEWLAPFREFAVAAMMEDIKADMQLLGIHQSVFSSERALVEAGAVDRAIKTLTDAGLIYVGRLQPPKGMKPDDWEDREQTLFRATEFGDDVDRPLKKSDGSYTYFANDIAYHHDKARRGFLDMIDVWGADHGGYIKRMQAAVKAITGNAKAELDVKVCQIVRLMRGGELVRMSKRAGVFVTLRELIDDVGKDVVRFLMLTRKNDAPFDFDLVKATEQSRDNPVWYVQYAHARTRSVRRQAEQAGERDLGRESLVNADLSLLTDPGELGLIRLMANWPRTVEAAAQAHEPHRLAFYLYDLASAFHVHWNRGKEDAALRFIHDGNKALTRARLALVEAVGTVIASGLAVFGVTPVEEMR